MASEESAEVKRLKREVAELRRANAILKAASAFFAAELDRPGVWWWTLYVSTRTGASRVACGGGSNRFVLCSASMAIQIALSTCYEWKDKPATARERRDRVVMKEIVRAWGENFQVYGARKVWVRSRREGVEVARCAVERLMREMGLRGVHRGTVKHATTGDGSALPGGLLSRRFEPQAPNTVWVEDFTYVSTWSGWVYAGFVIDAYARRILGWRCSTTMTARMVVDALDQAVWQRARDGHALEVSGAIARFDHGSQYTSVVYGGRLAEAGLVPLTGSVGDSYDNALAETINGLYKTELVKRHGPWKGLDHLGYATAEWVDWHDHRRIYQYCGDIPPVEAENRYYERNQTPPTRGITKLTTLRTHRGDSAPDSQTVSSNLSY